MMLRAKKLPAHYKRGFGIKPLASPRKDCLDLLQVVPMPQKKTPAEDICGCWDKDPGDDLLLHGLSHTTIGAAVFHFRVRDGIGWYHSAVITRERVEGRGFID